MAAPAPLGVNLFLVPVGRPYRPALDISARPDLVRAFARGEAARADPPEHDEERFREIMEMSADERDAYMLGRGGPGVLQATTPFSVITLVLVIELVTEDLWRGQHRRMRRLGFIGASVAALFLGQDLETRARRRRARTLGLTADTAPRPGAIGNALGPMTARSLLVAVQQLRVRRRTGSWGRLSTSSRVAAAVVRDLWLLREWRAAYEEGRSRVGAPGLEPGSDGL